MFYLGVQSEVKSLEKKGDEERSEVKVRGRRQIHLTLG